VRSAESLGYRAAYVDGDVSVVPSRGDAPVLHGWTATVAYLAKTSRIEIGSIRLVHHWNAALLAQAVATADCVAPGRLRLLVSIGAQPADRRFGLPMPAVGERIAWLEEQLDALRRLLAGEVVSARGRFVALDAARVRPAPVRVVIEVGGAGPRLLRVVARHAQCWNLNLPPVGHRVRAAVARLESACAAIGRDPAEIGRSMWLFARPGTDPFDPGLHAAYRRWNPWFRDVPDHELGEAIVAGPVGDCRARIASIRAELGVDLPVIDLSGLDLRAADAALHALAGA
jgi:alkanesulfonate monooxygenase SsuD/methylene tetrahydromethanopterin reductase-like flavin-dependent oxidoreductase (luciferase family)